jgi:catechol 2,3-dioxygenase-like lactoylglutathione lyase family enzyme
MFAGIDHIVVVVPSLDEAIANYTQLGFTVVPGGKHPIGTHNALIAFADGAYIELLAFMVADSPHPWFAALKRGGGLIDFCMQTDDLRGDVARVRQAGVAIIDPMPLTRDRPDGYKLSWVLSIPPPPYSGIVPFLIEDETPRDERVPRQRSHSNGVSGIRTLTIAVNDLDFVRRFYSSVLSTAPREIERKDLGGAGVGITVGPHTLEFIAPQGPNGPLAEHLRKRGASPYAAVFSGIGDAARVLDQKLTLGARLSIG